MIDTFLGVVENFIKVFEQREKNNEIENLLKELKENYNPKDYIWIIYDGSKYMVEKV